MGRIIGVMERHTRSLDYSSYGLGYPLDIVVPNKGGNLHP